jgi:hypothetical protein
MEDNAALCTKIPECSLALLFRFLTKSLLKVNAMKSSNNRFYDTNIYNNLQIREQWGPGRGHSGFILTANSQIMSLAMPNKNINFAIILWNTGIWIWALYAYKDIL